MKAILTEILLLLCLASAKTYGQSEKLDYQNDKLINELGVGVVQIYPPNEAVILYKDSLCITLLNRDNDKDKPIPLLNKPDYGILFFVCVSITAKAFKIAIAKNRYAYILKNSRHIFYDWKDFLKKHVISVESKSEESFPTVSIKGRAINTGSWEQDDEIDILDVKQDWLKIKNASRNKIYWQKWRKGNELLVYLNLLI